MAVRSKIKHSCALTLVLFPLILQTAVVVAVTTSVPATDYQQSGASFQDVSAASSWTLMKKAQDVESASGFAAEWEFVGVEVDERNVALGKQSYQKSQTTVGNGSAKFSTRGLWPPRRQGPGTWLDSNGFWWVFGGQGAVDSNVTSSINYLSDLWVYEPPSASNIKPRRKEAENDDSLWRLVYRPENDEESVLSSHPENLFFPLLCGNDKNGHLFLFGGHNTQDEQQSRPAEAPNSLFNDNGVVWMYDFPKGGETIDADRKKTCNWSKTRNQDLSHKSDQLCNKTQARSKWSSYICCDACLPDGNSATFDSCPQFTKKPILWCSSNALMAFQFSTLQGKAESEQTKESKRQNFHVLDRQNISESLKAPNHSIENSRLHTLAPSSKMAFPLTQVKITSDEKLSEAIKVPHFLTTGTATTQANEGLQQEKAIDKLVEKQEADGRENFISTKTYVKNLASHKKRKERDDLGRKVSDNGENEINSEEVEEHADKNTSNSGAKSRANTIAGNVVEGVVVNWWKFDLTSTEWKKMPEVNVRAEDAEQVASGNCRSVSDKDFVYIFCPTATNLLDRSVLLFRPSTRSVMPIGQVRLNNAFHDKKVWHLGRSVFHALRTDNHTVILLAYHKLLDLWIHDHSSNKLLAVENIWKGSSLRAFQHASSFYKLSIVFEEDKKTHHSFYMVNPRTKFLSFEHPVTSSFHITIVTDRSVFLPSRDAPKLNNALSFSNKSEKSSSVSAENTGAAAAFISQENKTGKVRLTDSAERSRISAQISIKNLPRAAQSRINVLTLKKERLQDSNRHQQSSKAGHVGLAGLAKDSSNFTNASISSGNKIFSPKPLGQFEEKSTGRANSVNAKTSQLRSLPNNSATSVRDKADTQTNNSQLKADAGVIPGSKNKRILGIKRTFSQAERKKIDVPAATNFGSANWSSVAVMPPPSSSKSNEMKNSTSTSRASLPVNNGSNRKPLLSDSLGESHANGNWSSDMPTTPKLITGRGAKENSVPDQQTWNPDNSDPSSTPQDEVNSREIAEATEVNSMAVNLRVTPAASALKLYPSQSLPTNLEGKIDPENFSSLSPQTSPTADSQASTESRNELQGARLPSTSSLSIAMHGNQPDKEQKASSLADSGAEPERLLNNYASSNQQGSPLGESSQLMTKSSKQNSHNDISPDQSELPYLASEELISGDSSIARASIGNNGHQIDSDQGSYYNDYSSLGTTVFFSLSLAMFFLFGVFLFIRRCVKCPPRSESVLIKEPPPISYSVIPDELAFHTPIV